GAYKARTILPTLGFRSAAARARHRRSCPFAKWPSAQPRRFRYFTTLLGIAPGNHRVGGRQSPAVPVLLGRHVICRPEVALQHLEPLPIFETDDVIRRH